METDDSDVLIWHYHRQKGAQIDMDKGFEQGLIKGRDKEALHRGRDAGNYGQL